MALLLKLTDVTYNFQEERKIKPWRRRREHFNKPAIADAKPTFALTIFIFTPYLFLFRFVSFGTFLACSIVGNLQSIMGQTRVERRKKTNVIIYFWRN